MCVCLISSSTTSAERRAALTLLTVLVASAGCGRGDSSQVVYSSDSGYSYADLGYDESWDTGSVEDEGDSADTAEEDECSSAVDTTQTLYMSADDSNSKAAPVLARRLIEDGEKPYTQLRPYEFLNYYSFDYTPADEGSVSIVAQARPSTEEEGSYELLIAVVAPALAPEDRKGANFTFSLDVSGSMTGEGIDTEKAIMRAIAGSLMDGDVVSIVTWDDRDRVVLASHEVSGPDDDDLLDAINHLSGGGSTDLSGGLQKAYELANDNYASDRLNRVILISDGGANTGVTDEELIGGYAEDQEDEGIYMMGIGAGDPTGYYDYLMDRVTDIGKGAYLYIDGSGEVETQFSGVNFVQNTQIAAYDVRLEMDLPAGYVIQHFSGEQISTSAEEVREQHLAPNDVMLYDIVIHDCAPENRDSTETFGFRATWSDLSEDHTESTSVTLAEMTEGENRELTKANAILSYVDGLQGARDAAYDTDAVAAIDAALNSVNDADAALGGDSELAEIITLLEALRERY